MISTLAIAWLMAAHGAPWWFMVFVPFAFVLDLVALLVVAEAAGVEADDEDGYEWEDCNE